MSLLANTYRKLPVSLKERLRFLYKYIPSSKNVVIKDLDGIKFELDLSRMTFAKMYYYGVYEEGTTNVIKQFVKPGMICFDIGASSGVHALRMANQVGDKGKVYAFEPSNWMYDKFKRNLEINENIKWVVLEKSGLSDIIKKDKFITTEHSKISEEIYEPEIEIPFTTIDKYIKSHKIKKVDFIKIDTDGEEVKILRGGLKCLKDFHPTMSIEFRPSLVDDLIKLLKKFGYRFFEELTLEEIIIDDLINYINKEVTNVLCR